MSNFKNEITSAIKNQDFAAFSKTIKAELQNRIQTHEKMQSFKSDYTKMQSVKNAFAQIQTELGSN